MNGLLTNAAPVGADRIFWIRYSEWQGVDSNDHNACSHVAYQVRALSTAASIVEPPGSDRGRPCVVLLHERYGLVQHTKNLATRLAADGYLVAVPDLFADVADRAALERGEIKVPSDDVAVLAILDAAVAQLADHARADITRLAMVGFCQTARYPLVFDAAHGLRACAIFYGAAQDREWQTHERYPVPLDRLIALGRAPVLGIFGERDHAISVPDVLRLRAALEGADRSYAIAVLKDAPHGFLNETMPGRHRPEQAAAAWSELTAFLARNLALQVDAAKRSWLFACTVDADYDFSKNVRQE